MTQRHNILEELKELDSMLATMSLQDSYRVPAGYFEGLADTVLNRVRALDCPEPQEELAHLSPLLSSLTKKTPYSTPTGYFESLNQELEENIHDELSELSALLPGISKQNPYSVPAQYFVHFPDTMLKKVTGRTGKVVSLGSRKWFRYAAAALVIGFVATGAFIWLNSKERISANTASYAWVEKNMKKVSTDDINKFIELADVPASDIVKKDAADEINNLMKDVSDKDIQDFLKDASPDEQDNNDDILLN